MRVFFLAAAIAVICGCSYDVQGTPTYDRSGVTQLYDYPRSGSYQTLGTRAWGFYRPSFAEPGLADVWEDLSAKVRAMGGNACIVRYQKVNGFTARNIDVTCEVLKTSSSVTAGEQSEQQTSVRQTVPGGVELSTPPPPQVKPPVELRYAYSAEEFAKSQKCNAAPKPVLSAKTPGAETYTVACANGEALTIRCEFGNCRALR